MKKYMKLLMLVQQKFRKPSKYRFGQCRDLSQLKDPDRARRLFDSSRFFKDEVFTRTVSIDDVNRFIDLKCRYHKPCLRGYELKYQRALNPHQVSGPEQKNNESVESKDHIIKIIQSIESRLNLGETFSLSDIASLVEAKFGDQNRVSNKKVKSCLIDYFGEKISFVYPREKNKPLLFYCTTNQNFIRHTLHKSHEIECASSMENSLKKMNFDLDDRFCDVTDLRIAMDESTIPEPFKTLFSKLFNFDIAEAENQKSTDWDGPIDSKRIKLLRMKCLTQMMYYMKTGGQHKTPLHTLIGVSIYDGTKSKAVITLLNRLGLSISYDEILRIKTRMAFFALKCWISRVPLPSHFNRHAYVSAALDNYDDKKSHDSVSVLFQDDDDNPERKPKISEFDIDKSRKTLDEILECQKLVEFQKPAGDIELPASYIVEENVVNISADSLRTNVELYDFIYLLSRSGLSTNNEPITAIKDNQTVPTLSPFVSLLLEDKRCKQRTGFLPVFPHPITEYSTVYSCMLNFLDVLDQLDQEYLPIACDEGVYRIARHIKFLEEKKFEKLILFMGNLHLIKVAMACAGKYLKNSGIENILIEANIFGVGVTEQILAGSDYAKSLEGLNAIYEPMRRLQLQEFFTEERLIRYENQIVTILTLQESFETNDIGECQLLYTQLKETCSSMMNEFKAHILKRCEESELYHFWNNGLTLISLIRDLVHADRTGNFPLRLQTLVKLQPIFHIMDRTNYSRWCAIYVEDMLRLEKEAPEVFREFMKGRFVVKRSDTPNTSVATDQALEASINRMSKGSGGVEGNSEKKESVTVWDLTVHEFLSIFNYFKEVTGVINIDDELLTHRENTTNHTQKVESSIYKILTYMEGKSINPFLPGSHTLKNITTEELTDRQVTVKLLNVFQNGIDAYETFRRERLILRTKSISAPIPRHNLPEFSATLPILEKQSGEKKKKVDTSTTQRIISLAKERNYPIDKLLTYDLTYMNSLFDKDGLLKKDQNKSLLIRELEKGIATADVHQNSDLETCLIIDVMLALRQIGWKGLKYFDDLAKIFCRRILEKAQMRKTMRIDFVFDSYFASSPKHSERLRRQKEACVTYHQINGSIVLPKQTEKFWGSSQNKILLQKFLRSFLQTEEKLSNFELVFSSMNDLPCTSNNKDLLIDALQCPQIEEADVKMILHVNHAVNHEIKNIYLLSSDTDVIVLVMHFFKTFSLNGLNTLWIRAGNAKTVRDIPIHLLAAHYGEEFCSVLPAIHHLTGSDYTSKIGTKTKALQGNPVHFLLRFAKDDSEICIEESIKLAEEYLVNIVQKSSKCDTFDRLRLWSYYHSNKSLIEDLPPTSKSIRLHILRAFYVVVPSAIRYKDNPDSGREDFDDAR
ncbi:hypothetical protein QAD02_009929 [Eretmocerus hayati]|uniref:Uncharacterized protein n=1 Tax=Eretmocerus hayati TaxID=131215 RepID=A0ACC2NBJ1_9HYME|nr:hypothetical protein QAD02_009929 [Eretmocerus hayati]